MKCKNCGNEIKKAWEGWWHISEETGNPITVYCYKVSNQHQKTKDLIAKATPITKQDTLALIKKYL